MRSEKQIAVTCKSAWHHLFKLSKIRKYLSMDQVKSAIHAYVTSKIDQNNSMLIGAPKTLLCKLQRVQNAAAKIIVGAKKHDHVTNILFDLHWLPVEARITFKVLLLTYKALNNEGPEYLQEILVRYIPKRSLRSSDEDLLYIPKSNLSSYGDRAFSVIAPKLWNNIPKEIRQCNSTETFKKHLKTFLFRQSF